MDNAHREVPVGSCSEGLEVRKERGARDTKTAEALYGSGASVQTEKRTPTPKRWQGKRRYLRNSHLNNHGLSSSGHQPRLQLTKCLLTLSYKVSRTHSFFIVRKAGQQYIKFPLVPKVLLPFLGYFSPFFMTAARYLRPSTL